MINTNNIIYDKYFHGQKVKYFIVTLKNKRFAIPDKCPHRGGPLSLGKICSESEIIQCPWHEGRYKISFLIKNELPAVRVGKKIYYL